MPNHKKEQYSNYTAQIEGIEIPINGLNTQGNELFPSQKNT